ncbi:fungal protein [Schizosaccharomyces japonicus yFS275]|uniref:Fungal protein n=1 Tax=Schizosaccharomyces japonicus (strain yFS275 / FY16936) TaxID=402676 RepID=B6K339_SCHJY|nr:fungal protein [Schizosaccharomyces japonicus yFS275]EEB07896.1 fungal protein [Schizosaccharomyces japonicus yFS275]
MEYGQVVSRKSLADEEETVDEVPDDALALLSQSIAGRISLDGLQTVPLVTEEKEGAETEEQVVTEESNLAFSLFSDVHQVSLEEKEEVIKQERPLSYYMVEDNEERRERLKQSLLTYEQIMEFSNEPWVWYLSTKVHSVSSNRSIIACVSKTTQGYSYQTGGEKEKTLETKQETKNSYEDYS